MTMTAKWEITGVIVELRKLTSAKNKDWEGYVGKIATLGSTFEVQLSKEQYAELAEGHQGTFNGKFEDQRGNLRLILTQIDIKPKRSAA